MKNDIVILEAQLAAKKAALAAAEQKTAARQAELERIAARQAERQSGRAEIKRLQGIIAQLNNAVAEAQAAVRETATQAAANLKAEQDAHNKTAVELEQTRKALRETAATLSASATDCAARARCRRRRRRPSCCRCSTR